MYRTSYNRILTALAAGTIIASASMVLAPRSVQALPSFARQTGQPCGNCHTDFPGLTPFGRSFKLGGYTLGGGQFRTTIFPPAGNTAKAESKSSKGSPMATLSPTWDNSNNNAQSSSVAALADYAKALPSKSDPKTAAESSDYWVPPVSMMAIVGFTHTQAPLPPPTDPFNVNDNYILSPISLFYGGAITEHIGAFAQMTYNGPQPGGLGPYGTLWSWDNIDIRYANTGKLGGLDVTYGITANNNPTVQDPWNTLPAWSFPYAKSTIAPTPAAATIIDGTYAAHVAGVGGYLFINDMLYLEATGYRTLSFKDQTRLGVNPFNAGTGQLDNISPYFRVAFEPHWGSNWLMIGAYAMFAKAHPWIDAANLTTTDTFPQTDRFTDIGFDAQYQYQGENFWLTLRGSHIYEKQRLDSSFLNMLSANPVNTLSTTRAYASLAYGNDNKVVFTGQYFNTHGSSDSILYGGLISCAPPNTSCSPDSNGLIAEIAYIPFGTSPSPYWPWFNARIALQYTYYNKFDGDTVNAHDNNTLFLHAWFAF